VPAPGSAMPARGNTSQIAHRFDCLAVTLEMPFKDTVRIRSGDFAEPLLMIFQ
jgi:hypothetical protein